MSNGFLGLVAMLLIMCLAFFVGRFRLQIPEMQQQIIELQETVYELQVEIGEINNG